MSKKTWLLVGALALALTGCTSPTGPNSNTSTDPTSATKMASHLQKEISTIKSTTNLTASTDPLRELGKKGEYSKAVVIRDDRVPCSTLSAQCGAEVLIWPSLDAAHKYAVTTTAAPTRTFDRGLATLQVSNALPSRALDRYKSAWTSYFNQTSD